MALTRKSRNLFIESAVEFVQKYSLDGLDTDWEYPGMPGNNNRFRADDKQNYTLLLKELRKRFDRRETSRTSLVTSIATGASIDFFEHTEMAKVERYVDTINLMSYDYYVPLWGIRPPDTTLPSLRTRPIRRKSWQTTPCTGMRAEVPANKIVLGAPFYGKSWTNVSSANHGLFQIGTEAPATVASGAHISPVVPKPRSSTTAGP
jgi:chitinase